MLTVLTTYDGGFISTNSASPDSDSVSLLTPRVISTAYFRSETRSIDSAPGTHRVRTSGSEMVSQSSSAVVSRVTVSENSRYLLSSSSTSVSSCS